MSKTNNVEPVVNKETVIEITRGGNPGKGGTIFLGIAISLFMFAQLAWNIVLNHKMNDMNSKLVEVASVTDADRARVDEFEALYKSNSALNGEVINSILNNVKELKDHVEDEIDRIDKHVDEVEQSKLEKKQKKTEATTVASSATTTQVTGTAPSGGNMTLVGYYELTAYEETEYPCANGNYPTVGYTVACNSLPLGTRIYIEGYGEYVVEDTGGMGGGVVDIYLGDPGACIQFGRQGANVYIIN